MWNLFQKMAFLFWIFSLVLINIGLCTEGETEGDYVDALSKTSSINIQPDSIDDYDQYEINEYEDSFKKGYHCSAKNPQKNESKLDRTMIELLDNNGIASLRPQKHHYQVRNVRQKMCQAGFNPLQLDHKVGSIHKRFKNTIRLMIYNTPGIFPNLKVIRSDLDRKRKREPQIWFRFEYNTTQIASEFDYDNYFITIYGDVGRVQAYSKMLVALKMHKRLNNFNDSISYKINLDLGIMEIIFSSFGVALIRDKVNAVNLLTKALNGIRTELNNEGDVQIEFEESTKEALDQLDPMLYSSVWLQAMAEKFEVVKIKDQNKVNDKEKIKKTKGN